MRLSYGKVGLGPNSLGILRYLLPYNKLFHIGAKAHDIGYGRGGTEHDRKRVDELFLMLCICASKRRFLPMVFARIYYGIVNKFGYSYFTYK